MSSEKISTLPFHFTFREDCIELLMLTSTKIKQCAYQCKKCCLKKKSLNSPSVALVVVPLPTPLHASRRAGMNGCCSTWLAVCPGHCVAPHAPSQLTASSWRRCSLAWRRSGPAQPMLAAYSHTQSQAAESVGEKIRALKHFKKHKPQWLTHASILLSMCYRYYGKRRGSI